MLKFNISGISVEATNLWKNNSMCRTSQKYTLTYGDLEEDICPGIYSNVKLISNPNCLNDGNRTIAKHLNHHSFAVRSASLWSLFSLSKRMSMIYIYLFIVKGKKKSRFYWKSFSPYLSSSLINSFPESAAAFLDLFYIDFFSFIQQRLTLHLLLHRWILFTDSNFKKWPIKWFLSHSFFFSSGLYWKWRETGSKDREGGWGIRSKWLRRWKPNPRPAARGYGLVRGLPAVATQLRSGPLSHNHVLMKLPEILNITDIQY